ncbi:biotin/lipoyl-containing protein [Garciella nitratireducens]|uniref:Biotin-requiring enzyme n=1 Tax=Garciella nitratireducens DSM 15102 TaxID=1121911 RepID=A0A1T4L706_9FIRM|nr:biotin/lipoyl-containing protein [Garciella nitratireducens]RBP38467.1 biotin-dependent enzyme [Garciella nitratireducens]SJZ50377.1 Biotin-requiring enzyme [Garciella nitratireducens DSM 15102]
MKKYIINVNGNSYEVEVEEVKENTSTGNKIQYQPSSQSVQRPQQTVQTPKAVPSPSPKVSSKQTKTNGENVTAPMPGTINKILVKSGDTVKKGDVILILEAMKMENEIFAPQDATIVSVEVNEGASVNAGDVLVTFE